MNKLASLTPEVIHIVRDKGTEAPHSGLYIDNDQSGSYLCRQCGLALYRSNSQFVASCGWPSFDAQIAENIQQQADADGRRTEILCQRCQAHLGHIFHGEAYTSKNTRHCVNSLALDFVHDEQVLDSEEAIFAAGCFWGVQYYFEQLNGVLKTEVGYTGGQTTHPDYETVCHGDTGHVEAIRVLYDCHVIDYQQICQYFFEIHDPTQQDGQGPDIGAQYLSKIFYYDEWQQAIALDLMQQLKQKNLPVATQLHPVQTFWSAEAYHQAYYEQQGKTPYCHRYVKRFDE